MTSEDAKEPTYRPSASPSVDEVRAEIERRVPDRKCPACGVTPALQLPSGDVVLLTPAIKGVGQWTLTGETVPALAFVCGFCGFVSLHVSPVGQEHLL
jgi:hypothetical protein